VVAQFANVNFWMNFKRDQSPLGRLSARVAASIDADENLRHNQSVRYSGQAKIVATIALRSARNDNQGILGGE